MKTIPKLSVASDYTIHKVFIDTFVVMFVSELSMSLNNITDGLMVSNFLGPQMLAGHSMVSPYFGMVAIISGLLATGMQISVSKHIGKGEFKKADNIFTASMLTCIGICLFVTVVCFFAKDGFASLFGAKPEDPALFEIVREYASGLVTGTIPLACNCVLLPVLQINGNKSIAKYTLILITIANIVFNYFSIFVFDLGMFGIGLGTSLSQWLGFIIYLIPFARKKQMCKFRLTGIRPSLLKDVLIFGLPKATVRICNTLRPLLINRWILYLATGTAMSAVGLNNNIRDFFRIPETAIALSVMLIAGVFYSEKDKLSLQKLVRISMHYNVAINVVLAAIIFIFAPLLASVYVETGSQVHTMAVTCLRWTSAGLFFYAANEYFMDFLLGTGRHKSVHLLTFLERFVYAVLAALVLGKIFGINGVFASFSVAEMCFTVHILIMVGVKNRRFPKTLTDFMLLPKGFDFSPDTALEFSIHDLDEVVGVSRKVDAFCRERNVDARRTFYAALCTEELAANILQHGFKDGKKHSLSIRLLYINDELILRLRDNCRLFDIREKYDSIDNKDVTANIGIRLVMKTAKDVTYINTLNLNTTIIKI